MMNCDDIIYDILVLLTHSSNTVICAMGSPFQRAISRAVNSGWITETRSYIRSDLEFTLTITEEGRIYKEFLDL